MCKQTNQSVQNNHFPDWKEKQIGFHPETKPDEYWWFHLTARLRPFFQYAVYHLYGWYNRGIIHLSIPDKHLVPIIQWHPAWHD